MDKEDHGTAESGFSQAEELRELKADQIGSKVVVDGEERLVIDVPSPETVSVLSSTGKIERVSASDVGNRENADRLARLAELTELARRRGSETPDLDAREELELELRKTNL